VGGVPNSAHAIGLAADFEVAGLSPAAVARRLQASTLVFDQLILETSGRSATSRSRRRCAARC
jgi:putative chitinase